MTGPLQGLKVVEFAGLGPGPHAAMVLADLGAEVVRVERPGTSASSLNDAVMRNRRVVEADLKSGADLQDVRRLITAADVLIEGFRPGVMERLGLGPTPCAELNQRLVYARMTGWGQEGPLAARAGHDINYIALTGALGAIGRSGQRPPPPLNLVGDYGGGSMFLIVGILAALYERARSGCGQVVDAAMVDGTSVLLQGFWAMRASGEWRDEREANLLDGASPFYDTYECADGKWVAVGAIEPQFYAELVSLLGLDEATLPDRDARANWPQLKALLAAAFAKRTRDEWTQHFSGSDACVTPVLTFPEVADDQHMAARGSVREINGVVQASPAPRFSRSSTHVELPSATTADGVLASWSGSGTGARPSG